MTEAPHVPVLKAETLGLLKPGPGMRIIDGTFGFGGHARVMLEAGAEVLGVDLDGVAQQACQKLAEEFPGLHCCHNSFRNLEQVIAEGLQKESVLEDEEDESDESDADTEEEEPKRSRTGTATNEDGDEYDIEREDIDI